MSGGPAARRAAPWPFLGRGAAPSAAALERFSSLTSSALVRHLFAGNETLGAPSSAEAEEMRMRNRLRRALGLKWIEAARAAGMEGIAIKGLAVAHAVYPDPDLRAMTDADLLVRAADGERFIQFFEKAGFRPFETLRSRWGRVSDAGLCSLVRDVDGANIDLHIAPDAYPVHHTLTTGRVFERSLEIDCGHGMLRIPSRTHMLILAATHAARDWLAPHTIANIVDAFWLIESERAGKLGPIDWDEVEALARRGGFLKPVRTFFALCAGLGIGAEEMPAALRRPPGGPALTEFRRLVRGFATMFDDEPFSLGRFAKLRRELLLTASGRALLRNNQRRLAGLLRVR